MSSNTTNSNNNKKEKVISAKGDEAEEMVLAYLIQQNRPYGATDISSNLKSRVSKPQAQKALHNLHERGEIMGKTYGKTTIYCALQKEQDSTTQEDQLSALRDEIQLLQREELQLKEEMKVLGIRKTALLNSPPSASLDSLLLSFESQVSSLLSHLTSLRSSSSSTTAIPTPSPRSLNHLNTQHSTLLTLAKSRRKVALEVQGMLLQLFDGSDGGGLEKAWENVGGEWAGEEEEGFWRVVREGEERERSRSRVKGKGKG